MALPRAHDVVKRTIGRLANRVLARTGYRVQRSDVDPYLTRFNDETVALPAGAEEELRPDNPRLVELRERYEALDWPVCTRSRWRDASVSSWLDLRYFRGDNAYIWHYRESERVSHLKFFVYLRDLMARDRRSLIERLGEDGLFGCWTHAFDGYPTVSRDLLDSVNELTFLGSHAGLFDTAGLSVLDVGAGYGRLAYRMTQAADVAEYCCVDAVPQSTFLCEYYTRFRDVAPPVRVVALPDVPALEPGRFTLACNVHSFSEIPHEAVEWWVEQLVRLRVPRLFVVPNESTGFLTTEPDGTRLDYGDVIARAGYRLVAEECAFVDPAVRELLDVHDRYCLFERVD